MSLLLTHSQVVIAIIIFEYTIIYMEPSVGLIQDSVVYVYMKSLADDRQFLVPLLTSQLSSVHVCTWLWHHKLELVFRSSAMSWRVKLVVDNHFYTCCSSSGICLTASYEFLVELILLYECIVIRSACLLSEIDPNLCLSQLVFGLLTS